MKLVADFVDSLERQAVIFAVPREGYVAPVRPLFQPTSLTNGINQTGGHVSKRVHTRLINGACYINPLAAKACYRDIHLRSFNVAGQAAGDFFTHFLGGQARHLHVANVGVIDGAVFVNHVAGFLRAAVGACGYGEFRVVPNGHLQHIANTDFVLVVAVFTNQVRRRWRYVGHDGVAQGVRAYAFYLYQVGEVFFGWAIVITVPAASVYVRPRGKSAATQCDEQHE